MNAHQMNERIFPGLYIHTTNEFLRCNEINRILDVTYIKKIVAGFYEIDVNELEEKTRRREIVSPRHVAMYLSLKYTTLSLKKVGESFGGRDHATVIHGRDTVEDLMDTDAKFKANVQQIDSYLRQKIKHQHTQENKLKDEPEQQNRVA